MAYLTTTTARLVRALVVLLMVAVLPAGVASAGQGSTSVSFYLGVNDWAAYGLEYPGDGSEVRVDVAYTPASPVTNDTVTLDVFRPSAPPPNGAKLDEAAKVDCSLDANQRDGDCISPFGLKRWSLNSSEGGTYVLVAHNWPAQDYTTPVTITLSTVDVRTGKPGPALKPIASSSTR